MPPRGRRHFGSFLDAEVDRAFYDTFEVSQQELADWRGWKKSGRARMGRLLAGTIFSGRLYRLPRRHLPDRRKRDA